MDKALQHISPDNKVRNGFLIAFCLLLISFFVILYANTQLKKQLYWIHHSYAVSINLETLMSSVKDAETSVRGFAITHDEDFLRPYFSVHKILDSTTRALDSLVTKDKVQQKNFILVKESLGMRMKIVDTSVKVLSTNGVVLSPYLLSLQPVAKSSMEALKSRVSEMLIYERALLQMRESERQKGNRFMEMIILIAVGLSFTLLIFGFFSYRANLRLRLSAISKIKLYQEELAGRVQELNEAGRKIYKYRQDCQNYCA
jgi:CHASE3 domain sensor protein